MRKTIKRCAVYAGLNVRIYPHLFRHTWATDKLRKGMDIRYVQEGLGHDDIRSTQIYTHVNVEDLRRELKRIMGKRK
jgi:site-specific recombinase XerD